MTAGQLLVKPGTFVKEYLAGKRVGYINPIKFFFYAFVAETFIRTFLTYATGDRSLLNSTVSDIWFQMTDLVATVFLGFIWFVFYRKSDLNAAECSIAALFYQAEVNLLSSVLLLLTAPLRGRGPVYDTVIGSVDFIVAAGYSYYFAYQLFPGGKLAIVIKQTVIVVIFLIVIVAALLIQTVIRTRFFPPVH